MGIMAARMYMDLFKFGVLLLIFTRWTLATPPDPRAGQGTWQLLLENSGVASMHTAVTRFNTVIFLDRTNIGKSQISLPGGKCRRNSEDLNSTVDCTAHSVAYDLATNTVRPLYIFTDTWCSSGQITADGSLVQTGGEADGLFKIRKFTPCPARGTCDWVELNTSRLQRPRWYASNQLLPDGRQIIIGGRGVFAYEFVPPSPVGSKRLFELPFLRQTQSIQDDNLYPFVHLLPNGFIYLFANRDSILLDYNTNRVIRTYPTIPGEPRNYPSAGSSVMLALDSANNFQSAEVLICGGSALGAFRRPREQLNASQTCGRMTVTSSHPRWAMESMPMRRCMGDMVLLPTAEVLIINGAERGSQGWGFATRPVLSPVGYLPDMKQRQRFVTYAATGIPRMYHASAVLLPDGRVMVAGSNTHQYYTFSGPYPTELRVEAFSPPYLSSTLDGDRPQIASAPGQVRLGQTFTVVVSMGQAPRGQVSMNLLSSPFNSHSYSQGQRLVKLKVLAPVPAGKPRLYNVTVAAPSSGNVVPPSYYMLFPVHNHVPGRSTWLQVVP